MKCFFQLVESSTGRRTPAFSDTRDNFARRLKESYPVTDRDTVYVLVIVEDADAADGQWQFSQAPMMTVSSFINHFEVVSHE